MKHAEKEVVTDSVINQLRIILKLASINAYDIHGRIRSAKGEPVRESDLSHILLKCMIADGEPVGEHRFVELLKEANIDPSWIENNAIKRQLQGYKPVHVSARIPETPADPHQVRVFSTQEELEEPIRSRPKTRRRRKISASPVKRIYKNIPKWDIPNDE